MSEKAEKFQVINVISNFAAVFINFLRDSAELLYVQNRYTSLH